MRRPLTKYGSLATVLAAQIAILTSEISIALAAQPPASRPKNDLTNQIGSKKDFFAPWEGAGVYVFGPIVIDLNRAREVFNPRIVYRLVDCSNEEFFCLTTRRDTKYSIASIMNISVPNRCRALRAGESWEVAGVRTEVLARFATNDAPLSMHVSRPDIIYYLGNDANPKVIYEYWGREGVVAVYHGLNDHPSLVTEVRKGLNPESLSSSHRMSLITFDRFAHCFRF